MTKNDILKHIEGKLIVSCQIESHSPMYGDNVLELMVKSVISGGASALRIEGEENIKSIRKITNLPIIGLIKDFTYDSEVFMTPTLEHVEKVVNAGADIVAIDGTGRLIENEKSTKIIKKIKNLYPNIIIFADVMNTEQAEIAIQEGADLVAPTFYRFDKNSKSKDQIDWKMFAEMCRKCKGKTVMEGKVWTPDEALKAFYYGAHSVVVGSAITRPHIITQRFVDHIEGFQINRSLFY